MKNIIETHRTRIKMIDRLNGDPVKNQMNNHYNKQYGKRFVKFMVLLLRRKIYKRHKRHDH